MKEEEKLLKLQNKGNKLIKIEVYLKKEQLKCNSKKGKCKKLKNMNKKMKIMFFKQIFFNLKANLKSKFYININLVEMKEGLVQIRFKIKIIVNMKQSLIKQQAINIIQLKKIQNQNLFNQ
ncbi:hypothetical protein TTHERM_000446267 (macronuclear) [Tetrahymena thermophila SB210]|uniref:Uncharacterized protein n=1 Tax=Tetrahymena thermophila (strain SB210) TaxID=312017 RepID=W7WZT2_TETTS|nr:hypothetical protein TTHERM_000446267 [Tetrahymena thermophila SB210]EWS72350.1 hypothetical protein TTHERM_000446267 [Tetrahymena thermophila SB210]|eukprot:XP_012655127.1 hypothetical protein TTHERM_000446267 [Tetrahymena thermophila SB210]